MEERKEYQYRKFSNELVREILDKSNGYCWYCGKPLTIASRHEPMDPDMYVIDHFVAKKNGGADDFDNLVPACCSCNNRKKARDIEDFRDLETRLRNNAPYFTDEQLYYLERVGINLPVYQPHVFYFEKEGLQR